MKNSKIYIVLSSVLLLAASCNKELPATWSGSDRLNFVRTGENEGLRAADTLTLYTFVFDPVETSRQTVWVEVETMGALCDYPRQIRLKQVPSYGTDAVPGVHYVDFDDPEVKDQYVIPAGKVRATLPVILKRDQLGSGRYQLRLAFEANEYFQPGYDHLGHQTVIVSDLLSKPGSWSIFIEYYCFGTYSPEKHQFMFDVTGVSIDADYLQAIWDTGDADYWSYLRNWFEEKLKEENKRREEAQEPLLDFTFNRQ